MNGRDVRKTDLRSAMIFGEKLNRTGIEFYFIGEKDLPEDVRETLDYLIGTTILYDPDNKTVITVYRNPDALNDIMLKPEYAIP